MRQVQDQTRPALSLQQTRVPTIKWGNDKFGIVELVWPPTCNMKEASALLDVSLPQSETMATYNRKRKEETPSLSIGRGRGAVSPESAAEGAFCHGRTPQQNTNPGGKEETMSLSPGHSSTPQHATGRRQLRVWSCSCRDCKP